MSVSTTAKYGGCLKDFLTMPKGQITSSILIINYYHSLKKRLDILIFFALTNNYCHSLKKGLQLLTASILINNYCCGLKKGLETQLVSTTLTLFIINFDIFDVIFSNIKTSQIGYTL